LQFILSPRGALLTLFSFPFCCSWGGGANVWGTEKDDKFTTPNHWDGMLEVVGVTGVVHLGQIQSGLRSAIRIVQVYYSLKEKNNMYFSFINNELNFFLQGSHIKIHMNREVPVQVCLIAS
jgi:hypothetical protein